MYKKYVKRRGRLTGPYYYESVRLKNGKIRAFYLWKDPNSQKFKDNIEILKLKGVFKKADSIVIPVEPGIKRPKREFDIEPRFLALKEFFGDKFSKLKSNVALPKFNLPKFDIPKFKFPKFKLPELKSSDEINQRKLEEYSPKPGLNDFDFHAALVLLLSVIFVFGFFFLEGNYVGFTTVIENITFVDDNSNIISGLNESNVSVEVNTVEIVLNVLN